MALAAEAVLSYRSMEGTIIGQYRIVQKIGAGGMGVVYLAEHTLVGRRAAIKVLLPEYSVRRAIVTRFFNEARAMTSIPDPGIVQMYDFGFHSEGSAYIVMELLEGETLERRLKRLRRLEIADAVRITRQIAGSLASAHDAGIIHRDLKPDNVFMVRDPEALGGERPKVLDFGVAKLSGDLDRGQTLAGTMMGTPAYMSPEQARGAGDVDARSDIYSLGCVTACLVTGRLPFDGTGIGELISAHMNLAPHRPSDLAPGVPAELDEIVLRCLEKSPGDRFQSMVELQATCDALLAVLSVRDAPLATGSLAPRAFTPRSAPPRSAPARSAPRYDAPVLDTSPHPTTLSSAAGATSPSLPPAPLRRRIGVWIGIAATAIAAGVVAAIAMTGRAPVPPGRAAAAPATATAVPSAPAAGTPDSSATSTSTSTSTSTPTTPATPATPATPSVAAPAPAKPPSAAPSPAAPSAETPAAAARTPNESSPAPLALPAPAAKTRGKGKPHRPAPADRGERPDSLYDDR
jgi:serine/threonine-protein kinase